jgi:phospholipase/carboxylesterase
MPEPRLEFQLHRSDHGKDGSTVAVLLHGRGSHMGDLQGVVPALPDDWSVVTPQAPFHGAEWGYGPGYAWYRYIAEDRVVEEALTHSLSRIDDFLRDLPEILGFTPGSIILGGFSQGGTMSTAYALTRPDKVTAALNFSGFLAAGVPLPSGAAAAAGTPIFWAHGLDDPAIPFALAVRGRAALAAAGVPLTTVDYPIGHYIVQEELSAAVDMVNGL